MKSLNFCLILTSIILLFNTKPCLCQGNESRSDPNPQELLAAAREIMNNAITCALITLDDKGIARVRAMDPFDPEPDLTVWFGTKVSSRKVSQIEKDPRVTLYYLTEDESGYVQIHGMAELVSDPHELNTWWKDEWEAFYPERSTQYILIKVSPLWAEVVSYAHGITGDPVTWQAPVLEFETLE